MKQRFAKKQSAWGRFLRKVELVKPQTRGFTGPQRRHMTLWLWFAGLSSLSFAAGAGIATSIVVVHQLFQTPPKATAPLGSDSIAPAPSSPPEAVARLANGRPALSPLPAAQEVWNCNVVVIGGSLGGVAAAAHAMQTGATTCLIELSPWMGGQVSAQGVSAIDESRKAWADNAFSRSWVEFKQLIEQQPVRVSTGRDDTIAPRVTPNNCWVGRLCFLPQAGAAAASRLLKQAAVNAPRSHWGTGIAFKGADFDHDGKMITAVYAVRRVPRRSDYVPQGLLSKELESWYAWDSDSTFTKIPLRLQAPPGQRMVVIDATDTGELVGWAGIPHRLGTDSRVATGERDGAKHDNPSCIQAFTYPFVLAIHNDGGSSLKALAQLKPDYSRMEHIREYSMKKHPMFTGDHNFFNYRRILSTTNNNPFYGTPAPGDMTVVNWNRGNDWTWMNPPLLLSDAQIDATGQRQNWLGGMSVIALRQAQEHALLFAQWLMDTQAEPQFPLALLSGANAAVAADTPMGTLSGLSMLPYIREGRRIIGRPAYGQKEFMIREPDLRLDLPGGRNFGRTSIGVTHYAIDLHGCRYRNWEPSGEANAAPAPESRVRPLQIPLESLIPRGVDNLLIGGKSLAVTHIANSVTRTHYSEWSIGAAAGATAGWLMTQAPANLTPASIPSQPLMAKLQRFLVKQGLRLDW